MPHALILPALLIAGTLAPAPAVLAGDPTPQLSRRFIVEPNQLPGLLKRGGVVLLSAQSKGEVAEAGFVNNAIPIDVDALTTMSEIPGIFSDNAAWDEYIGSFGIDNRSTAIVYDDGELKFASRVRFLLNYFGVRRTLLVNGGFNAMARSISDGRLTLTSPGTPSTATFDVSIKDQPIHLVDQATVLGVLGNPAVSLADVRTPAEFAGCLLLPGIDRGGHIPGARNLPIEELLTSQSGAESGLIAFLDRPGKLNSTFRQFQLRPNDRIIVYCQDGAKSSLAATALIDAGYKNVSLYYLSYLDWQSNPDNLVESIAPCPSD
ncbi:MAG: sulfurtransferase [Candidatus Binataceae bacterium]